MAKRTALRNFVQYVITGGQAAAATLNYAPLPTASRATTGSNSSR
jgi:phosphate transport system substrate-binding protein